MIMTAHHNTLEDLPIAIIGGGLADLTLSVGLSRFDLKHKIYESAKVFSEIGAGIRLVDPMPLKL
jgi:2-polyprenyl-6-methoxyphenol hydroxylase-like FAD-dependent oxidoreductase